MQRIRIALGVLVVALTVVAGAGATAKDTTLNLIAYSTPKPALSKIIQAYQQTPSGGGVSFTQSYA
jgi:ABC-type sulfate transport system substrate-binding protein